jgi:CRP-like cAMP-binding protein
LNGVQHCVDLDRGLEVCEDGVLMNASILAGPLLYHPLGSNGLLTELSDLQISDVLSLGQIRDVPVGEALFHKDEPADGIWLLESGVVSILVGSGPDAVRLATFGPGQFVGEMGFVDGKSRSASAYADTPVRALLLNSQAVAHLIADHPQAALIITRNIARELSQRVRLSSALMADQTADSSAVWADHALGNPSQF